VLQLGRIQLVGGFDDSKLQQEALRQRTPGSPIEAVRGGIYDRHPASLTLPGATSRRWLSRPSLRRCGRDSAGQWQAMLSGVPAVPGAADAERDGILGVPAPPRRPATNVTPEVTQAVWRKGWPGITTVTEIIGEGPGALARHLVGYVLPHAYTHPVDSPGVAGLKARYDAVLAGEAARVWWLPRSMPTTHFRCGSPGATGTPQKSWSFPHPHPGCRHPTAGGRGAGCPDIQHGAVVVLGS